MRFICLGVEVGLFLNQERKEIVELLIHVSCEENYVGLFGRLFETTVDVFVEDVCDEFFGAVKFEKMVFVGDRTVELQVF